MDEKVRELYVTHQKRIESIGKRWITGYLLMAGLWFGGSSGLFDRHNPYVNSAQVQEYHQMKESKKILEQYRKSTITTLSIPYQSKDLQSTLSPLLSTEERGKKSIDDAVEMLEGRIQKTEKNSQEVAQYFAINKVNGKLRRYISGGIIGFLGAGLFVAMAQLNRQKRKLRQALRDLGVEER